MIIDLHIEYLIEVKKEDDAGYTWEVVSTNGMESSARWEMDGLKRAYPERDYRLVETITLRKFIG